MLLARLLTSAGPSMAKASKLNKAKVFAQNEDFVCLVRPSSHDRLSSKSSLVLSMVLFACPPWPGGVHPRPGTVFEAANEVALSLSWAFYSLSLIRASLPVG